MVTPDGAVLTAARVLGGIRGGYGRRRVHISIENPTLLWSKCNDVAARYEEWQQTDGAGVDRVGRVSTVVFARDSSMPHGLRWLTVHETWLASQHTS